MSVINKMLQDLDKRGASPRGVEGSAHDEVAPLRAAQSGRRWKIPAWLLIVPIAVGAVLLALWLWPESPDEQAKKGEPPRLAQLKPPPAPESPSPAVAPSAAKPAEIPLKPAEVPPSKQSAVTAAPAAPSATAPAVPAASAGAAQVPPAPAPTEKGRKDEPKVVDSAPPAKAPPKPPAVVAQASIAPAIEPAKSAAAAREPRDERRAPERKDGTITISKRPPAPTPAAGEEKSAPKPSSKLVEAKPPAAAASEPSEPPARAAAAAGAPAADAPKAAASGQDTTKSSISIERPDRESSRAELAAREFRSAVELMNQGRVELAIGTYASALRLDPKHVAARQAMVVLLMERARVAEAQSVLRDGLLALPGHTAWAMLLARIQVGAGDAAGALETLDSALPYAKDRPDYHAFVGTVLQMQARHKEAIAHYEIAVRLSPDSGRWLTGLAISLEEEKRVPEARDAYSRALATTTLGRELQAFVERKLAQLR